MSIINLTTVKTLCKGKHFWKQIETDSNGKPTKYKCVDCQGIFEVKKDINSNAYFDKKNSIFNRIQENNQKIKLLALNPIGLGEKIHISHLTKENAILQKIMGVN